MGLVTPLGCDVKTFWDRLVAGDCAIDRITAFDPSAFSSQIAAEVRQFDPAPAFPSPKELRRTDRFCQFAVYAAWSAMKDAGLDPERVDRERVGVYIGSGIGGLATTCQQHMILLERGPGRMSPYTIPMLISNMGSGLFAIYYNFQGPNYSTCSACATSSHAIGEAWRTIKMGDADVMFAGGAEATIIPIGLGGFCAMHALSTRNDDPKHASRPFDADRDGFVMGEGAGVVVLEELEHARRRGARIYCEVIGYGATADAHHVTAPDPEGRGAARCMRIAMDRAGLNPTDVDYINAHGTATPLGDVAETKAIKQVFGEHAYRLKVSSIKGAVGHLLGAAGGVELIATALTLQTGIIPPTINLEKPDPDCDLDYVPNTAREVPVRVALSNSFGFGGQNATIAVRRFD